MTGGQCVRADGTAGGWSHSDSWRKEGRDCLVEVSRCKQFGQGNVWSVYIYIYPKHPAFSLIKPHSDVGEVDMFNCHSYVSYFKTHTDRDGNVTSHQIGWDYNHDGDWMYRDYESEVDAASVFIDAEQLLSGANNFLTIDTAGDYE